MWVGIQSNPPTILPIIQPVTKSSYHQKIYDDRVIYPYSCYFVKSNQIISPLGRNNSQQVIWWKANRNRIIHIAWIHVGHSQPHGFPWYQQRFAKLLRWKLMEDDTNPSWTSGCILMAHFRVSWIFNQGTAPGPPWRKSICKKSRQRG